PAPAALEASDNEVTEVTRPSRPAPRANRQPMASTAQAMEHLARHKPPLPIPMSDAKTGLQGGVVISGVSHVEFGPKRNRRPRRLGNEATLRSEYRPRSPREVRDRRAMEQQPERRGIERRRLTCR